MSTKTGFIFKVLILSTVLSILIKYGGRYLNIPPTSQIALFLVLLPSVILAIALRWRQQQQTSVNR